MAPSQGTEILLKALVFADSCDNNATAVFSPTKYLHSKPVITWQLSTLARYGVKEIIVLSAKPIEIPYEDPLHRLKITQLSSPSWCGEGDALREIEGRSDIRPQDDFIVVRSGSIFNINVSKLVEQHKARKAADRNWLLTSVLRRGTAGASTGVVIAVDLKSGTMLKYSERCTSGVSIDVNSSSSGLASGGIVEIASNIVDTGLDVCSPEVLLEFKENFDFDRLRALTMEKLESGDAETLGNRMFAHFTDSCSGEYAARIDSLAELSQVTIDVFNGWMLPISLRSVCAPSKVHHFDNDVYVCSSADQDCETKKSAKSFHAGKWNGQNCVVGQNTKIGANVRIRNSVIGEDVVIGEGVVIENSIILSYVSIESDVIIKESIISNKCTVGKSAKIPNNCLLDDGVIIGKDFQGISPRSLISTRPVKEFYEEQDTDDEDSENNINDLSGSFGKVRVNDDSKDKLWRAEDVGLNGVGYPVAAPLAKSDMFFSSQCASFFSADASDQEDDMEQSPNSLNKSDYQHGQTAQNGFELCADELNMLPLALNTSIREFHVEVFELLERGRLENVDINNTILEANSLRLSYNVKVSQYIAGIVDGIARNSIADCERRGDANVYAAFVRYMESHMPLLEKYIETSDESRDFQVVATLSMLYGSEGNNLMQLLFVLYNQDVIEKEGICLWASKEQEAIAAGRSPNSPYDIVKPFIDKLGDAEESDEED